MQCYYRLQEKIRRDFTKETGKEMEEKLWDDWVASSKNSTGDKEADKVNYTTCGNNNNASDQARDDTDSEAVQDIKELDVLSDTEADIDSTRVLCSLPSEKSHNGEQISTSITLSVKALSMFFLLLIIIIFSHSSECKKLEKLGNRYKEFVKFLKGINLPECANCVEENGLDGGDMIAVSDDEILKEYGLRNAVDRLRFRVLFQRELLQQTPQVAQAFPVEKVATFFSSKPLLKACVPAILENKIDGEMLLLAGDDVMKELGISKGKNPIVRKYFRALVLAELP